MTKLSASAEERADEEFELLPDEATAEPYHLSREMLRELGSCGPYIRAHHELFPSSEFPDGPPVNSVTCRRHADAFDWGWAANEMLDWDGRRAVSRIADSRAQRYRALGRGGESNRQRYAAAFGYVFATQPNNRNSVMARLAERAEELAGQRAHEDLAEARQTLVDVDRQVEALLASKARTEAELPALEAAVENVKVWVAERAAARTERELRAATERLETLQAEAVRLRAEADRLAAESAT